MPKHEIRVHTLVRVDGRPITDNKNEIRAFMTVRDEISRLPHTIEHHRKLGVTRFLVVDNGSSDGCKEFLLAQPDCHVFTTANSHSESGYGAEWWNALLNEYGANHWCLTVDADEWFVYPGYEKQPLTVLAGYLERSGAQGMFAFLLDMYGSGAIAESTAESERSLLDACRYFDRDYTWHRRFYLPGLQGSEFPPYEVFGGPRLRIMFPLLHRHYYLLQAMWLIAAYTHLLTGKTPLPRALRPAPRLWKIPFLHWRPGTRYENVHSTTPIKLSDTTGALLHFKFLQDFYMRVSAELNRKEQRATGVWAEELGRYRAKLQQDPTFGFRFPGSVEYEGSEQLVRLGLMKDDKVWRQLREMADMATWVPTAAFGSRVLSQPAAEESR
ncbi:MAG: glycosyltransferase family 2 protein [Deltaproteobacteria bacterium]|nr:glycosyltransferase family 2 protein [Deltaproteobacteria bacterium]